jgi:thymidylate synthase ThyX
MQVTQVALRPTPASEAAGRPSLTPELLAASGARYSRNNEGLQAILSKIDPNNLDKSVDSIFRMVDYGHQSIADMAPVAMFLDGVSQWLAYYVWTLCPTAGGQESSTRYIRLAPDNVIAPDILGIPENLHDEWRALNESAFAAYEQAVQVWEGIAARDPNVARIPKSLLEDESDKAAKAVARMRRN